MKLLLASNSEYVIQYGLRLLFKDISEINLAYITTAANASSNRAYVIYTQQAMQKNGYKFSSFDIEKKSPEAIRDFLKDKNVVWVEGGNTFYLLKMVKASGFDKVIVDLVKKEKIVYIGTSAGSYIACPTIEVSTWKRPGEEKSRFGVTDLSALSLVPFLVKAHFKEQDRNLLKEKSKTCKYPVKILRDGQAILAENESYKLVGEKGEIKI
ncbi:MAG: Type 1 glutamine amidotransferase-like domain-containing protein [Patescibacteria group bacterium]|nr:Type 1 glutamine amidotransferase-like domain-containing protein [Patescibacteria group bacterium]